MRCVYAEVVSPSEFSLVMFFPYSTVTPESEPLEARNLTVRLSHSNSPSTWESIEFSSAPSAALTESGVSDERSIRFDTSL